MPDTEVERTLIPLLVAVRSGEGLSESAFEDAVQAIRTAASRWQAAGAVPLAEASVILALYPDLASSSYLYADRKGEWIREAARLLSEEVLTAVEPA